MWYGRIPVQLFNFDLVGSTSEHILVKYLFFIFWRKNCAVRINAIHLPEKKLKQIIFSHFFICYETREISEWTSDSLEENTCYLMHNISIMWIELKTMPIIGPFCSSLRIYSCQINDTKKHKCKWSQFRFCHWEGQYHRSIFSFVSRVTLLQITDERTGYQ